MADVLVHDRTPGTLGYSVHDGQTPDVPNSDAGGQWERREHEHRSGLQHDRSREHPGRLRVQYDVGVTEETLLIDAAMREALAELEAFLEGVPEERAAELVLPFASRWVLPAVGFDLGRLRKEAETMRNATPLSDRIVAGHADHLAYWVGQRMLLDEHDRPQPAVSAERLAVARATLAERAAVVEGEGFPRVAAAIRRVLDESSGGEPPDDRLWSAMALRIAEAVLS
jgi:hypothetical protein